VVGRAHGMVFERHNGPGHGVIMKVFIGASLIILTLFISGCPSSPKTVKHWIAEGSEQIEIQQNVQDNIAESSLREENGLDDLHEGERE